MPAATPVAASMVARRVLALVQVPPDGLLPNAVLLPEHTKSVPVIADGRGNTVSVPVV